LYVNKHEAKCIYVWYLLALAFCVWRLLLFCLLLLLKIEDIVLLMIGPDLGRPEPPIGETSPFGGLQLR